MREVMKKRNKNEVESIVRIIDLKDELRYEVYKTAYKLIINGMDFDSAIYCTKKQFDTQ